MFITTSEITAKARKFARASDKPMLAAQMDWRRLEGEKFDAAKALLLPYLQRPTPLRPLRTDAGDGIVRIARGIGMSADGGADQSMRDLFGDDERVHPDLRAARRHQIAGVLSKGINEKLATALHTFFTPIENRHANLDWTLVPELEAALSLIRYKNIALLAERYPHCFNASSDDLIPFHLTVVLRHALRLVVATRPDARNRYGEHLARVTPFLKYFEQGNFPLGVTLGGTFVTLTA